MLTHAIAQEFLDFVRLGWGHGQRHNTDLGDARPMFFCPCAGYLAHPFKRTIQKYMRCVRLPRPSGQKWATFLHNHAADMWACDFLQVTDLFFRSLFAFFLIELKSRKVIHVGVTRFPTDAWTAQQLREATPYGQTPRYLI
jgi:hypothetical protein